VYDLPDEARRCQVCNKALRSAQKRFCSKPCQHAGHSGEGHPCYKGGSINASGYATVKRKGRDVLMHRIVMEEMLGRSLLPNENVHHKNGVRTDNRPENLELWVRTQPCGQRPEDLVNWAKEILALYDTSAA